MPHPVLAAVAAALSFAAPAEPSADAGRPGAEVLDAGLAVRAASDAGEVADAGTPADAEPPANEETPAVSAPAPETPEEAAGAAKVDEAAREMEELKAAEAAVVDEGAKRASEVFKAMRRAGPASPLHQRMQDVLGVGRALPIVPDQAEMDAAALSEIGSFDIEKAKKLYDIPVEMQPLVAEYIRFFQVPARWHFVKWIGRSFHWLPMMKKALREAGLPEDTVYLSMIESGFAPIAYSRAKAVGLWQFIEPTGRRFGLRIDFWEDERRDPVKSSYAAAAYLKALYAEFGDWKLAWAGYNAGEGMVRLAIARSGSTDFWKQIEAKRAYRKETRHYVPKLMAAALIMKHLKFFGFAESEYTPEPELQYEDVEVPEATDLDVVARAAGTTVEVLKDLNPSLSRWCTPPSRNSNDVYKLHLPVGTKERFAEEFPKIAPKDRMHYLVHVVQKGDTLSKIAQRYGSVTEIIMRSNGIKDSRRLRLRMELVVPVPRGKITNEQMAQTALKQGFKPAPAAEEVPAAPPPPRRSKTGAIAGSTRVVQENGKPKTIYAVADGDSLWSIARKFDVHVADVKMWNGIEGNRNLKVGEELSVFPGVKTPEKPGAGPGVHVVQDGDTLSSVAQKYKVSVEDLRKWNNLDAKKKLKVGQSLSLKAP
jgi:membrane-bound lytic murein transglycosylase D